MFEHPSRSALLAPTALVLSAGLAVAASGIRTERVHFKAGANSAVVEGTIKGDDTVDYVLGARQGQSMNVSMTSNNGANYFNIIAPGETDVAMFNGSTADNQFEGVLPASGDYKIRVYLMRSAARRNEVAKYRLEMIIADAGKGAAAPAGGGDAKVAGTDYNATGNVPCSMGKGQPTGSCPFGVKRTGGGSGSVTLTKPDGRTRTIFFEKGKAISADVSQADPGELSASREGDLTIIKIGDERYEIPDAVIFGG